MHGVREGRTAILGAMAQCPTQHLAHWGLHMLIKRGSNKTRLAVRCPLQSLSYYQEGDEVVFVREPHTEDSYFRVKDDPDKTASLAKTHLSIR